MRTHAACLAIASVALAPIPAPAQEPATAFVHFNVLPMTADTVLRDHTVLVAGGRITAVGPSRTVRLPPGATRVDGGGTQFLLPALADMHTHSTHPRELALFASHGVLTILNLAWSPDEFVATERNRYNSGERFGPTIFEGRRMNWPYGGQSGIATVAQGRDTVRYAKQIGYEFIKVYGFLADTVYDAIMKEASAIGMPVVGHRTNGIGLPRAFRDGLRMVVHAEELGPMAGVPVTTPGADSTVRLFREHEVWLTPTLSTFEAIRNTWGNPARLDQYIVEAQLAHLPATTAHNWRRNRYHVQTGTVDDRLTAYLEITRRLHQAGVPLLAGTDGPGVPGMIPGVAIHDELRILQSVGLTRFEALAAATSNPGRFVAQFVPGAVPFGTISKGARADMLIVAANPLADLAALREPISVVRLGRVYSAAERDSIRTVK